MLGFSYNEREALIFREFPQNICDLAHVNGK